MLKINPKYYAIVAITLSISILLIPASALNVQAAPSTTTLKVIKIVVPPSDKGKFNLKIDGSTKASHVSNGGSTKNVKVTPGLHKISETGYGSTHLSDYTAVYGGDCNSDGTITLASGNHKICTITNTKKTTTLKVTKIVLPSSDNGKFNLKIDGSKKASHVSNGGTTGDVNVTPGLHKISETGYGSTHLSDYTAVYGGDCNSDGTITLASGNHKICTITNTKITNSGSGVGSGTGSDSGSGAGSGTGSDSGSGAGSGTGSDSGSGAGSGTGSDSGSGAGSGTGSDSGSGAGSGTGSDSGSGAGSGTGSDSGSGAGSGTGSDSGSGAGSGTGSDSGSGAGSGTGSDSGSGAGSGTGSDSGSGAGSGTEINGNSELGNNFVLHISSQITSGQDLPGFFTILAQDNQILNVGFTPIQFDLISGQEYQVGVSDFAQYKFDHWLDNNSTDSPRTIAITQDTSLVAVYSIIDTSGSGEGSGSGTGIPTIHKDDSSRIPPPSLSGNGQFQISDGFTVGGDSYTVQNNLVDIPTHRLVINVPQTIVVKAYSDSALGAETTHISLNIGPHPMSNIGQSVLSMTWDKASGIQVTDPQGFVSNVSVNKQTVGSVDTFTFTFTPLKDMPTSDVLIRAWNSKMSSIDYLMTNAVKFTGEFLSPAPSQLPATLKVYDNISDLQKQLDEDGYAKPHILSRIHDTSSIFNGVPGKIYWFYDTADKTVALVIEDGSGKVLDMQIEILVAQSLQTQTQNFLLGNTYYSHHILSRNNADELDTTKYVEELKALNLLMQLYGRDYVVQYHFLG